MAIFLESFCTLMFLFPKAVVDENFKSIACRERHLRSSCQFMLFRNCYLCAGVSIAHSRHVRSCCMQLKFPGGGPADPLLARLWLGKAGARRPNIAGQGKVLGLCRFFAQKIRGGARCPFGCFGSARQQASAAARTMPGKAKFWDFAVFLGKSWP